MDFRRFGAAAGATRIAKQTHKSTVLGSTKRLSRRSLVIGNLLGLRELLQRYADEQWLANHMTDEKAVESVLDCFVPAVAQELEILDLRCQTAIH
jgi:hypothetical protein